MCYCLFFFFCFFLEKYEMYGVLCYFVFKYKMVYNKKCVIVCDMECICLLLFKCEKYKEYDNLCKFVY